MLHDELGCVDDKIILHFQSIILDLNPTHHHQHNTSYSITSYNIIQVKDSISTINMQG
jgi:hypothetical protein